MSTEVPNDLPHQLFAYLSSKAKASPEVLMDLNSYTGKFGVILSKEDALFLLEARNKTLRTQERIEFDEGILPKLIFTFCDSPYIYQDNYTDTLERLQEIFYLYKNESLDECTDDELLEQMHLYFNGICEGSLDHLEDTCLESFSRDIRSGNRRFIGLFSEDEEIYEEK